MSRSLAVTRSPATAVLGLICGRRSAGKRLISPSVPRQRRPRFQSKNRLIFGHCQMLFLTLAC